MKSAARFVIGCLALCVLFCSCALDTVALGGSGGGGRDGGQPARAARVYLAVYRLPPVPQVRPMWVTRGVAFVPVHPSTGCTVAFEFRIEPGESPWTIVRRNDEWVSAMYPGARRVEVAMDGERG